MFPPSFPSSWFPVDLVSVLPFDLMGIFLKSSVVSSLRLLRVVRLLRLTKLARIFRASRIFQRLEAAMVIPYNMSKIIKSLFIIVFASHWVRSFCGWEVQVGAPTPRTHPLPPHRPRASSA